MFLSQIISMLVCSFIDLCERCGSLLVSALVSEFEPAWPEILCCVLGQDALLSQCLSPPRCVNRYQRT